MLFSCTLSERKSNSFVSEKEQPVELNENIQHTTKDSLNMNNGIYLNYDFSKSYPNNLRVTEKNIYVGDGKFIYRFDYKGSLLNKISLPNSLDGFIDFAPYELDKTIFYATWNGKITCFDEKGQIIYISGSGDFVKIDSKGIAYSIYQEYDKEKDKILNKIKIIDPKGNSTNYTTNYDLGCLNFEVINNSIMLHSSDNRFYILPLDRNLEEKSYNLKGLNDERVWFLGMSGNNYIFRTFEFEGRKDKINVYDLYFNHKRSELLNFSFDEIVFEQRKDEDFLMDNPTATMYAAYNNNIYFLRNTTKGSYIMLLN